MKIAYMGMKGLPSKGGAERVVEAIVQRLAERHDITVYCGNHYTPQEIELPGVRLIHIPTLPGKHLQPLSLLFFSVLHALWQGNYDLVHLHNVEASCILPLLRLRFPVVATSHGSPVRVVREKWSAVERLLMGLMEYPFLWLSNHATSVSRTDAEYFQRRYGRTVAHIPNGTERLSADRERARERLQALGVPPGKYLLFSAARIDPTKGCHLALEALQHLGTDVRLVVIGNLEQVPKYTQRLYQIADKRAVFVPFVASKEELFGLVQECRLFIFPSLTEAMSMMVLEVASLAAPLLCSDIPENREILGEHALYFRSGDAQDLAEKILWALAHPEAMRATALRAEEWVRSHFQWSRIVEDYETLYCRCRQQREGQEQIELTPGQRAGTRRTGALSWPRFVIHNRGLMGAARRIDTVRSRFGPTPDRIVSCLQRFVGEAAAFGCSPTLAVTAVVLNRHPDAGRQLQKWGAELAIHGHMHTNYALLSLDEQLSHLNRAKMVFEKLGIRCRGFRAPYLFWNPATMAAVAASGLEYDSSCLIDWNVIGRDMALERGWQWERYRRLLTIHQPQSAAERISLPWMLDGIVEIPASYPDDESLVDWLGLQQPEELAEIWLAALRKAHQCDELFNLQLHHERVPFCQLALKTTLAEARLSQPPVWVATLGEIAGWWRERQCFRWECSGPETYHLVATGRGTLLSKGLTLTAEAAEPWAAGWFRVKGHQITVTGERRPVVGVPQEAESLAAMLAEEGYVVEAGQKTDQAVYLDGPPTLQGADRRHVLAQLEACPGPLIRFARWPDGARGALAVTGDIDAITWGDFFWRLLEF